MIKVLLDSANKTWGKGSEGYVGDAAEIGAVPTWHFMGVCNAD